MACEKYPKGLPQRYSDDATQWTFTGETQTATDPLQVAVARLIGYRWPEQADDGLDDLTDDDGIVCVPQFAAKSWRRPACSASSPVALAPTGRRTSRPSF